MFRVLGLRGALLALLVSQAAAHDPDARIREYTKQIQKHPHNAKLYLQRGDLYRQNQQWRKAVEDFDQAQRLDTNLHQVDLARAQLHLEVEQGEPALQAADRFLVHQPDHATAHLLRARALHLLRRTADASAAYQRTLQLMEQPRPEHYLELARVQAAMEPPALHDALHTLDQGMKRLGCIVSLQEEAIAIELQQGKVDQALSRLEAMRRQAQREESWWIRQAEVLLTAGRGADALCACEKAQQALDELPESHRQSGVTVQWQRRLHEVTREATTLFKMRTGTAR